MWDTKTQKPPHRKAGNQIDPGIGILVVDLYKKKFSNYLDRMKIDEVRIFVHFGGGAHKPKMGIYLSSGIF